MKGIIYIVLIFLMFLFSGSDYLCADKVESAVHIKISQTEIKNIDKKWHHILTLYDQLILIEHSPVTALNRAFALAQVHGYQKAIIVTEKLKYNESSYYHQLLGYLYSKNNYQKAIQHYDSALKLTKSKTEKEALKKEIGRLTEKL